jgi:hypothetical protein
MELQEIRQAQVQGAGRFLNPRTFEPFIERTLRIIKRRF